ncbi:MAG: G5 domain-containing protein [Candidatus Daviesbacteria bacterium]|nr:G5 domain-containing protein [Candidatus Daviesbacteria bacterium]
MAERIIYTIFGAFLVIAAIAINNHIPVTRADNTAPLAINDEASQPIKTDSQFQDKIVETSKIIPYKTTYKDDPETEAGEETVLEEGVDGKKTSITKITYHQGTEYDREVIATETTEPTDKIISRGTKIVWRTVQTTDGEIRYWKKMRVWATHYDSHCPGCNEWTSIGMKQGKGVIAVDPKVIKYRTKLYVPGYGMAVAGDTGGAIKGNIIDLGFEDARTAGWSARFADIYLID